MRLVVIHIIFIIIFSCNNKKENKNVETLNKLKIPIPIALKLENIMGISDSDSSQIFGNIQDIAVDSKNNLYVADVNFYHIKVFDSVGNYIRTIGRKGQGPGEFLQIVSICLDNSDNLFVLDVTKRSIQQFSSSGEFINQLYIEGIPNAIAIDDSGYIYINNVSIEKHLIEKYDKNGKIIRRIGSRILNEDKIIELLYNRINLLIENEFIYAGFLQPYKIDVYDHNGKFIYKFDGTLPFDLKPPYYIQEVNGSYTVRQGDIAIKDMYFNGNGLLYVSVGGADFDEMISKDISFHSIDIFNSKTGDFLKRIWDKNIPDNTTGYFLAVAKNNYLYLVVETIIYKCSIIY